MSDRETQYLERRIQRLERAMRWRPKKPPYLHSRTAICPKCEHEDVYDRITRKNRLRDQRCTKCQARLGHGAHRRFLEADYDRTAAAILDRQMQRVEVASTRAARRAELSEKPGNETSAGRSGRSRRAAAPPTGLDPVIGEQLVLREARLLRQRREHDR